jgi:hypothetical protein
MINFVILLYSQTFVLPTGMSSSMQILSIILFANINEWSSNGTRFYRVNQFSFYQDTIVRILQCLVHKVNGMQYIFFLSSKISVVVAN